VVHCPACGYAANVEKATSRLEQAVDAAGLPTPERFDTPGARTIEDLAVNFAAPATRQVKTLVYVLDGELTLVLLRGDHPLSEQKLADLTGATALRPAHADEIREALGASPGSLGAVGVADLPVLADEALRGRQDMFTGANTDDVHLRGVNVERDITVRTWADLREVTAGEPCVRCGQPLQVQRAIEVGHIFKLGYKYSTVLDATVLDPSGTRTKVIMGSYGIGVERAMSAIVEGHHDDKGIVWPMAVAPFQVVVVVAQADDSVVAEAGEQIYRRLLAGRIDAIIDDRDVRAGVKFRDVELVGIPLRVTVGKRTLGDGLVELTDRAAGRTESVPIDQVDDRIRAAIEAAYGSDPVG
jgi:prolyl-tRNA synthetase